VSNPELKSIYDKIDEKGWTGMTARELRDLGGDVAKLLAQLERVKLVVEVGLDEPRWVSDTHQTAWACRSIKLSKEEKLKLTPTKLNMVDLTNTGLLFKKLNDENITSKLDDRL